jgi:putative serine protease PepD
MKRLWIALCMLTMAALSCNLPSNRNTPVPTSAPSGALDHTQLLMATVRVMKEIRDGDQFVAIGSGSGTLVSASGLILTNAHVASPASRGEPGEPDRLTIAIVRSEDQPPILAYIARVMAVDGTLDLAVLQIVSTLDGTPVNPSTLNLPFVPLGNSDDVRIGDHLNVYGFPGVGFDTITYTEGSVAGFIADDPPGERAWIKTDANIAHGNSGGLAADDNGEIVGIPTSGLGDCDQADTNGDGEFDTCIPNGNAINFLRPINFAIPLIEAARLGREYVSPYPQPGQVTAAGSGNEAASDFVWLDTSKSTSETCEWLDEEFVRSYLSSAFCIAVGFEYAGMTRGEQVREVWYLDGSVFLEYPFVWEEDSDGYLSTYLPNNGEAMPPGEYYLEVYAGESDRLIGASDPITVTDN